jgi:hypothetical protein
LDTLIRPRPCDLPFDPPENRGAAQEHEDAADPFLYYPGRRHVSLFELSPDVDYELKADFQGASSGPKTLSSFDSKKKAVINLKLNKK